MTLPVKKQILYFKKIFTLDLKTALIILFLNCCIIYINLFFVLQIIEPYHSSSELEVKIDFLFFSPFTSSRYSENIWQSHAYQYHSGTCYIQERKRKKMPVPKILGGTTAPITGLIYIKHWQFKLQEFPGIKGFN